MPSYGAENVEEMRLKLAQLSGRFHTAFEERCIPMVETTKAGTVGRFGENLNTETLSFCLSKNDKFFNDKSKTEKKSFQSSSSS